MPDILIQHIDTPMAERIKSLAKQRQWSINDVVLNALRHGLGIHDDNAFGETLLDEGGVVLSGHWDAAERAVFQEAVRALTVTPETQFAPAWLRKSELA
jgi:hypothetical protein